MARVKAAAAAVALALMLAALPANAQYSLTVVMTRFIPIHEDELFELRVVDSSNGQQLGYYSLQKIMQDEFSTSFYKILYSGKTYYIDAYADYNENMHYDPPPQDHAWRIVVSNVTSDTTIALVHTGNWTDIKFTNDPNSTPEPGPTVTCSCDLNGDGASDVFDVLEWLKQVRSGTENECLDYNQDGKVAISDLVRLLVEIRSGGCM